MCPKGLRVRPRNGTQPKRKPAVLRYRGGFSYHRKPLRILVGADVNVPERAQIKFLKELCMKKIFLALLFAFFAISTSSVFAKGEGVALGQAWQDLNAVCVTIADQDETTGNYVWSKDKVKEVGVTAKAELAKVQTEVTALESDTTATAVTGKNSLKSLKRLLNHALKAIDDLSKNTTDEDA